MYTYLMSIYCGLNLSIVNAVESIYWESMQWAPYLMTKCHVPISHEYILWTQSLNSKCCGIHILGVNAVDSISHD